MYSFQHKVCILADGYPQAPLQGALCDQEGLARGPHRSPRALLPGALCGCQGTRMESYHLEGLEQFLIADTEGH